MTDNLVDSIDYNDYKKAVPIGDMLQDSGMNHVEKFSNLNHTHNDIHSEVDTNHSNHLNLDHIHNNINAESDYHTNNINLNNENDLNGIESSNNLNYELTNNNMSVNLDNINNEVDRLEINLNNINNLNNVNDSNETQNILNHPAFITITENLHNQPVVDKPLSIQSNRLSENSYDQQIKTFNNQHDIQGLDLPRGIPGTRLINTSASF